ncbi:MAG: hypothetical protein ACHP6H_06740, partial [Legionellales bacterium]
VEKLAQFRHEQFPQLLSELETIEERMGLKPGLLTNPVITSINASYISVAQSVNKAAKQLNWVGANIKLEEASNLEVLFDEVCSSNIESCRVKRLYAVEINQNCIGISDSARDFFVKLEEHAYSLYKDETGNKPGALVFLAPEVKLELIALYKSFQVHFAALYPDLDAQLVEALTSEPPEYMDSSSNEALWVASGAITGAVMNVTKKTVGAALGMMGVPGYEPSNYWYSWWNTPDHSASKPTWAQWAYDMALQSVNYTYSAYKYMTEQDQLTKVLDTRARVLEDIQQSMAQAQFQVRLVNNSIVHRDNAAFKALGATSNATVAVKPFVLFSDSDRTTNIHEDGLVITKQLLELESAQRGLNVVISFLQINKYPVDKPFSTLSNEEKQSLQEAYKKFQSQALALDCDYGTLTHRQKLHEALTVSLTTHCVLTMGDLTAMSQGLDSYIAQCSTRLETFKKEYVYREVNEKNRA